MRFSLLRRLDLNTNVVAVAVNLDDGFLFFAVAKQLSNGGMRSIFVPVNGPVKRVRLPTVQQEPGRLAVRNVEEVGGNLRSPPAILSIRLCLNNRICFYGALGRLCRRLVNFIALTRKLSLLVNRLSSGRKDG